MEPGGHRRLPGTLGGRVIRLAIVNDYEVIVHGLRAMLEPFAGRVEVVELDSQLPVVQQVDVALYDTFGQSQGDGRDVREMVGQDNIAKVAVYSWNLSRDLVEATLDQGVHGYLGKSLAAEELIAALEALHEGETVVRPEPTEPGGGRVSGSGDAATGVGPQADTAADPESGSAVDPAAVDPAAVHPAAVEPAADPGPDSEADPAVGADDDPNEGDSRVVGPWPGQQAGLTAREAEVLTLIALGMTNIQIAEQAHLSINSVKSYIRNAYRKIEVTNRAQAVLWGVENGLRPDRRRVMP